jgi:endonuclease YncB( thermonuclease family)
LRDPVLADLSSRLEQTRCEVMTDCRRLIAGIFLLSLALCVHARTFEGVVTHVTDGDSLWVRPAAGGAPRQVRLQGIDAPEICQAYGAPSRDKLAAHVLHRHVAVNSRARDSYQRALGSVSVNGQDLGAWMVGHGYAWSHRFHRDRGPYAAQEARARKARLGLWADGAAMEPREFRKRHGSCK